MLKLRQYANNVIAARMAKRQQTTYAQPDPRQAIRSSLFLIAFSALMGTTLRATDPRETTVGVVMFTVVGCAALVASIWVGYLIQGNNFWRNIALGGQELPGTHMRTTRNTRPAVVATQSNFGSLGHRCRDMVAEADS